MNDESNDGSNDGSNTPVELATERTPTASTPAATLAPRPVTSKDRANIADAIIGELRRSVAQVKNLKPKDVELLQEVTDGAIKLSIDMLAADPTDEKLQASLVRRKKNVEAQLAGIKSLASSVVQNKFWSTVESVLARLSSFALTTALAAI